MWHHQHNISQGVSVTNWVNVEQMWLCNDWIAFSIFPSVSFHRYSVIKPITMNITLNRASSMYHLNCAFWRTALPRVREIFNAHVYPSLKLWRWHSQMTALSY